MTSKHYNPKFDPSMLALFKNEVDTHIRVLTTGILNAEAISGEMKPSLIESLLRAAHSIKGAAKMVGIDDVVTIAHALEDCFIATQKGLIGLTENHIDIFLISIDLINSIANNDHIENKETLISSTSEKLLDIKKSSYTLEPDNNDSFQSNHAASSMFRNDAMTVFTDIQSQIDTCQISSCNSDQINKLQAAILSISHGAKLAKVTLIEKLCDSMANYVNIYSTTEIKFNAESVNHLIPALSSLYLYLSNPEFDLAEENDSIQEHINSLEEYTTNTNNNEIPEGDEEILNTEPNDATPTPVSELLDQGEDYTIKVSSQRLSVLVGLASEALVESRWVRQHAESLYLLKKHQSELNDDIEKLRNAIDDNKIETDIKSHFDSIQYRRSKIKEFLTANIEELEDYDRRLVRVATRLSHEVQQTRMRPFSDAIQGLPRMVRDLARSMGKKIRLDISGNTTQVDREILERIETPINHIVRNAIDHGIENANKRQSDGKNEIAVISIEATHAMGMLSITIKDDGKGIDYEALRQKVIEKKVATAEVATTLSKTELLEFLYLPGFTTRDNVTDISGRGVGLDVVYSTINDIRGKIRTSSVQGKYLKIQMLLPLTLSMVKCLLVSINEQVYAFPLSRIDSIHTLPFDKIEVLEGKQYFSHDEQNIGLVEASQVLEISGEMKSRNEVSIIVLSDLSHRYGLVVDSFLGEKELSVHILAEHLGKIRDVSAAALLENGEPVLIIDTDDMMRSISMLVSGEYLQRVSNTDAGERTASKRVLVVDDSITVREVEKKLLTLHGYHVDIAIDGMDALNTIQSNHYDLVVTDIDMPRMNGIELVKKMKASPQLSNTPIMIISYKDREEDKNAGLQAGADYYLTKGSFHDEGLVNAVIDLIGEA